MKGNIELVLRFRTWKIRHKRSAQSFACSPENAPASYGFLGALWLHKLILIWRNLEP